MSTRYYRFTAGGVVWPERKINDSERSTLAKPVVVIDPEDREQVERLSRLRVQADHRNMDGQHWEDMQAALREFANPRTEVLEHYVTHESDGTLTAHCGKVWKRSDNATVAGRCPSCVELVKAGWSA